MPHGEAISIMMDMVDRGELNEKIVHDMDTAFLNDTH